MISIMRLLPVLSAFFLSLVTVSCSGPVVGDDLNLKFIGSPEDVGVYASQFTVGESTGEEVVEALGTPFLRVTTPSGELSLQYMWRTKPVRTEVDMNGEVFTFDPNQSNHKQSDFSHRVSDTVQLIILVDQDNLVRKVSVKGS